MKLNYSAFLMLSVCLFTGFANAETCNPEKVVEEILTKQRSLSGGQFYTALPSLKDSSSGQVYEVQFSSFYGDGSGEIGSIEVQVVTCKVAKFQVVSSSVVK